MATGRRGGPLDLKGTLGTLLRTTLNQMAALRDAVEHQARSQRGWFDSAMLSRQRKEVLASLGEVIYQLAVTGELGDLEEFPEVSRLIYDLEEIDSQIEQSETETRQRSSRKSPREVWGRASRQTPEQSDDRVWRPMDPGLADEPSNPEPEPRKSPRQRGGRPRERASRERKGGIAFAHDGAPADGDDSDLSEYMHEDDVRSPESGSEED